MQTPMGPRGYRSSKIQGPFFVPLDVFVIISVKNDIDKKRLSLFHFSSNVLYSPFLRI